MFIFFLLFALDQRVLKHLSHESHFILKHWISCILETRPTLMSCRGLPAACDLPGTRFTFWQLNSSKSLHVFVTLFSVIYLSRALYKIKSVYGPCLLDLLWPPPPSPSWSISCILNATDPLVTPIRCRHTRSLYTKGCSWAPDAAGVEGGGFKTRLCQKHPGYLI